MVSFEEFKKLDLRIATVTDVQDHPNADKLYVLHIEIAGVTKQIVARIKKHYAKDELKGKQVVVVNNLAPVSLRGVESQGMLLAASDEKVISVLIPDKKVASGSLIK